MGIDMYRSLVGQVMCFATKLGATIGNAVRILSGFMGSPSETHWKALGRFIGYMKYMKVKYLMYITELFCVSSLCDTNYGN